MPSLFADADRNMLTAWQRIIDLSPRPGRAELDGVVALSSGIPMALFNPVYVTGEVRDPSGVVQAVVAHYAALGSDYAVVFRDEAAPGLAAACTAAGLIEHWQMPLMVLDPVPASPAGAHVDGLVVTAVDEATVAAYVEVLAAGFGMPLDLAASLFGAPLLLESPGFTGFLGTLHGEPVATSGVYVTGDTAGVYNVAPIEAARGRGVGAALTWASALAGREAGAARSILQASEMGEPVYARMGYATPARYRQFEGVTPS